LKKAKKPSKTQVAYNQLSHAGFADPFAFLGPFISSS